MAVEHGVWTMYGMDWDDPYRIRSCRELINWINEIGFLPFFKNEIEGFSAEEHTSNRYWWTGNKEQDPWEWREIIARSGEVAYGKFFHKRRALFQKSGFPILQITGEMVMILTQGGKMVWQVCVARRLWMNLKTGKNG